MSFSRINLHSSREHDRMIYSAALERKPMGLVRVFFTALVILFSALMYYVTKHYVPALANPRKVLRLATETVTLPPGVNEFELDDPSAFENLMGPYYNLFHMDRAYMKPGQSINIKYDLPKGAYANLDIVQCRRAWVVEIFKCDVVSRFNTKTKRQSGVESFALKQGGFYYFEQETIGVPEGEPYRIVWERGQ